MRYIYNFDVDFVVCFLRSMNFQITTIIIVIFNKFQFFFSLYLQFIARISIDYRLTFLFCFNDFLFFMSFLARELLCDLFDLFEI